MSNIAANLEFLLECEPPISIDEEIGVLRFYAPAVERWIDGNRVAGSERNAAIARSLLALYTRRVTWHLLESPRHTRSDLRAITIRLRNLT